MQKLVFFTLAALPCSEGAHLRRTKMTYIEEQMSTQMKLMMPERATLNNIEASIISMAKQQSKHGGAHGASNLTAFLDQIQTLIDKTMKANILERQNQTQVDLDQAWANLTTCSHPNDTTYLEDLVPKSETHQSCRKAQDSMWSGYEQSCIIERAIYENEKKAVCDKYKSINVFPNPTTTCVMSDATPVPTIGHYLEDMEAFFDGKYTVLKEWKDKCENATNTPFANEELCKEKVCVYYDKKIECDKSQGSFEQLSCDVRKNNTCSKYKECYEQKEDIYDSVVTLAKESETAAKAEWRAVLRIECLINALRVAENELSVAIDTCKEKRHATTPVELTYHSDPPGARDCTEVYLQPGAAMFSSTWYSGLPDNGPAESCASTCCMDAAFNPTYPDGAACPYVKGATTTTTTTTTTTKARAMMSMNMGMPMVMGSSSMAGTFGLVR